jgi:hypothetical protein
MDEEQFQRPPEEQSAAPSPGIDPFSPPPTSPKNGFSKKRLLLVALVVLLIGGIGFGAALLTSESTSPTKPADTSQADEVESESDETTDIPIATATKTLKTDFPRIELAYPDNWIVTENKEQSGIRLESPEFTYMSISGSPIKGNFRVYIRQGARQQDSKYIGRGVAAQPSEKLIYTNPIASQRPETNLSFFGLDSSDNFAYFLIAGNFSLQKEESLGPEYGTEAETYIIAGGYSSKELAEDLATNPVPVEYFSTTEAYKQALEIVKSLKIY